MALINNLVCIHNRWYLRGNSIDNKQLICIAWGERGSKVFFRSPEGVKVVQGGF